MIKGDYDRLKDLAKFNMCAEHHTPLEVAWHGQDKTWVLRCDTCGYPDAITRQLSLTEAYKAGEELPSFIEDNVKESIRRRQMFQDKRIIAGDFEGIPNKDLATGELLAPGQVKALMEYANKYKLDPFRGHVVLMYGKPYFTIDAYLFHAKGTGIPYTLMSHPMTEDEKKAHMIDLEDHAWLAIVRFTGTDDAFNGIGIVTQGEMIEESKKTPGHLRSPVVAAHPWQLAQKRAEWQVMRRAFPIGEAESVSEDDKTRP